MARHPELIKLLTKINQLGLTDAVKKASPIAYETAKRIIDTGYDIQPTGDSDEEEMAFDTQLTARVLSNPLNWGIKESLRGTAWENLD